jgi:ATP-dependent Clp protease ATP-binding subunit ClpA
VRIIGATTLSEYKEFIQEDEALSRRFRTVQVNEPSIEERAAFSTACGRVSSATTRSASWMKRSKRRSRCRRAISGHLHLPDKVIGWLDTAAVAPKSIAAGK